ncbi:MAG: DNA-processing protein DprA [Anaerolineae bacterium]
MSYSEASNWLACLSAPDLKRAVAKHLLWRWCVQEARSAAELYTAEAQEIAELGLDSLQVSQVRASRTLVAEQAALLTKLEALGINLITRADAAYPETLTQRLPEERLPYLLYYRGNLDLLSLPGVALVGAGQPSEAARTLMHAVVKQLAPQDCVFIGGYNKGIDRFSIEAALAAGASCIVVLPLGLRASCKILPGLEPHFTTGKLLVLSPYSCDTAHSEPLAAARLPVIAGLSEMLLAIEPDDTPDPWVLALQPPQQRIGIWVGAAAARQELWLAHGAIALASVEEALRELQQAIGIANPEPAPGQPSPSNILETLIAFIDADSAIKTLSQTGDVPDVLARRLRERAPEWNR